MRSIRRTMSTTAALLGSMLLACAPAHEASSGERSSLGGANQPADVTREPPPRAQTHPCDPLPAERPSEISIAVTRTVVPHGAEVLHETGEVVSAVEQCTRAPHCRVVGPETLDELYALAREHTPSATSWTPVQRSPHFGSRHVHIAWNTGRCEVGESSQEQLDERGRIALNAMFDAIVDVYASPQPR